MMFSQQIAQAAKLDAIIVPSGEPSLTRPRSNHALWLFEEVRKLRKEHLGIIVSGYWTGIRTDTPAEPECAAMAQYLREEGVPANDILVEGQSLDTMANVYFSKKLGASHGLRKIGIVTQAFHARRANAIAERFVLPRFYGGILANEETVSVKQRIAESFIEECATIELNMHNVYPENIAAADKYMDEWHPFNNKTGKIRVLAGPYSAFSKLVKQ